MKIAIPLFNKRISPRFDCAQGFLLAVAQNGEVIEHEEVSASRWTPLDRVEKLSDLEVDTLICGGIDKDSARRLIYYGVRIYSWVTGMAEDALQSLLKGELEPAIMVGPGGRRRGRWRFRKNMDQPGSNQRGQVKGRVRGVGRDGSSGGGWGGGRRV